MIKEDHIECTTNGKVPDQIINSSRVTIEQIESACDPEAVERIMEVLANVRRRQEER